VTTYNFLHRSAPRLLLLFHRRRISVYCLRHLGREEARLASKIHIFDDAVPDTTHAFLHACGNGIFSSWL
jgi:hypothetical protein